MKTLTKTQANILHQDILVLNNKYPVRTKVHGIFANNGGTNV